MLIQAGTFQMGSNDGWESERPAHNVRSRQPFYLGKYPVTQAQWAALMGNNPSEFKGDPNRPVENVSWEDVQEYIRELNRRNGGEQYRLPTEAEWEYACRAGTATAYHFGNKSEQLGQYGWYKENAGGHTHPVGKRKPNGWGLHDMHGNVWEWVEDWYAPSYAAESVRSRMDHSSPAERKDRVNRGGSWVFDADFCRSATRGHVTPGHRAYDLGFRLLRTAP
jgi:formylglycine-generating enzyme required for sulfatase activity